MKSSRARRLAGLLCVCGALLGPIQARQAQQRPAQQQRPPQPTFRAGVSAVRVDVIVTDRKGDPVDNLAAADFEIIEDGKPQPIDTCRLIRVQMQQAPGGEAPRAIRTFEDEETELARDDVRIIVMLLDDYHVSRMSAMNLRGWLHRFIDTELGPYDLMALMYPMTPTAALTFTRDKFALTSAVDRFEGRRGDYMPRNQIEANYAGDAPWRIEEVRNEVVGSAIKSACYHLGTVNEGRKSLIVVAETLSLSTTDLREVIDAANRNNVAIYPLDPHALSVFGASDVLRALAEETNGRAITERNDMDKALGVVLRDSSAYYLLGYASTKGADGKFHQIKVRVKKPGLEVRARKGYWAPTAAEAVKATEPAKPPAPSEVTAALGTLAQPRGRAVRSWLGASRGNDGKTRLAFVWEPAVPAAGGRAAGVGRVMLVASAPDGKTCYDGAVGDPATPSPAGAGVTTASSRPAGRQVTFDAPPGRLQMKLTVEAASSMPHPDVIETETRDVIVPDLSGPRVALSTPAVFSTRTPRQLREVSSDPGAVPTVNRAFDRAERLLIRFEVYGGESATPQLAARLLNRNGDAMTGLPTQPSGQRPGGQAIDLPLATLARGDYVIEISAKGQGGEAKQFIAIRVTG